MVCSTTVEEMIAGVFNRDIMLLARRHDNYIPFPEIAKHLGFTTLAQLKALVHNLEKADIGQCSAYAENHDNSVNMDWVIQQLNSPLYYFQVY